MKRLLMLSRSTVVSNKVCSKTNLLTLSAALVHHPMFNPFYGSCKIKSCVHSIFVVLVTLRKIKKKQNEKQAPLP